MESPELTQMCDPHVSVSQVLRLQVCATIPATGHSFED
jgi:hypothetical protein